MIDQPQSSNISKDENLPSALTPEDLARRIKKYLMLGSSLQEMKLDALKQGISEKLWKTAIQILYPKKQVSWGKIVQWIFVVFLILVFVFIGSLFYFFSQTSFYSKVSGSKFQAFFQEIKKSPFVFSENIFLGRFDLVKLMENLQPAPSVKIQVQDVLETQTGSDVSVPPSDTLEPANPSEIPKPTGVKRIRR